MERKADAGDVTLYLNVQDFVTVKKKGDTIPNEVSHELEKIIGNVAPKYIGRIVEMVSDELKKNTGFQDVVSKNNLVFKGGKKASVEDKIASLANVVVAAGIAETILQQMGGMNRIHAMTGAHSFTTDGNGVSFLFPNKKRSNGNAVKIDYNAGADLYDMTFYNVSVSGRKVVKTFEGVYFDQLIELFERQTGLYLKM